MNKSFLKILTFSLLSFIVLMGCAALEDKPVPDPKPYQSDTRTPIQADNLETFNGNYRALDYIVSPEKTDVLDIVDLKGSLTIQLNNETNKLQYLYGFSYTGYDETNTNFAKQTELIDLPPYTVESDRITVKFTQPLVIKNSSTNETYTINSIQKVDDNLKSITDTSTVADINYQFTICDPFETGTANDKSCTSPNGAMKYIGYYRIETITCGGNEYTGGQDFAGEMVTNPSLAPNLDVTIPITVKIQVSNSSNLKQCLLTTEQQTNNNMYFTNNNFLLTQNDYSGGLNTAFEKVGLIGLQDSNQIIRTSQIDYEPKNNKNFTDLTFGDGNNLVNMRLKMMLQGELGQTEVKTLENTPYTTTP